MAGTGRGTRSSAGFAKTASRSTTRDCAISAHSCIGMRSRSNAIVGNGGVESACGWRKDRWGLNWQITPRVLIEANFAPANFRHPFMSTLRVDARRFKKRSGG